MPLYAAEPEEEAPPATAGASPPPPQKPIVVADMAGALGEVDPGDLRAAERQGYHAATPAELRRAELEKRFGGVEGAAAAAFAGGARGLTLGLSDPVWKAIYGPQMPEILEGLRETHPMLSGASEIGGAVAPLVLSGGTGAAVKGGGLAAGAARGISTVGILPRAVAAAGRAAEGAVGKGIARFAGEAGKGALATAGTRALATAAQMGVEGAFYGAGSAISEATLGDTELTGEKVIAGAGKGILFGAALGGLTGGGASLVASGARGLASASSRARTTATGYAERAVDRMSRKLSMSLSMHAGEDAAQAAESGSGLATRAADAAADSLIARQSSDEIKSATGRAYATAAKLGSVDADLDTATRALTKVANAALHVDETVLPPIAFGEGKAAQMAKLVDPEKWEAGYMAALAAGREARKVAAELAGLPDKGGSALVVKRLESAVDHFEHRLTWSIAHQPKEEIARDAFMYLDTLKRDVGRQAAMGTKPWFRNAAQKEAYDLYHRLIEPLQRESAWGPAALAQKEINLATTNKLATSQAFKNSFITDFESKSGNAVGEFDPADVKAYLRNVIGAENDLKEKALTRWMDGLRGQMDAVEKHYTISASERAQFAGAREALDTLETTLASVKKDASEIAHLRRLREDEAGRASHGLAGLAADYLTRPIATAERLGTVRRMAARAEVTLKENAERIREVKRVSVEVDRRVSAGVSEFFRKGTRGAARASGLAARSRDDYEAAVRHAVLIASSPELLSSHVSDRVGDIHGAAPKVAASASQTAMRAVTYLASKAPQGYSDGTSITPQTESRSFSDDEIASFARSVEAVEDPMSMLDDLRDGDLTSEQVDAVRVVYPRLYEQVRTEIGDYLAEAREPLSYQDRIALGVLFDMPTDETMTPAFLAAMAAVSDPPAEAEAAAKPGGTTNGNRARKAKALQPDARTGSENIEANLGY